MRNFVSIIYGAKVRFQIPVRHFFCDYVSIPAIKFMQKVIYLRFFYSFEHSFVHFCEEGRYFFIINYR